MFKNYFKTAWRSLNKNRLFSFINIFGLALSMSVCMLVMLRTKDEFRYDLFHPFPERTYRIISDIHNKNGDNWTFASSPLPLQQVLKQQASVIGETVQLYPTGNIKAVHLKKEIQVRAAFTDDGFFRVFGFSLENGNPLNALSLPNSVVLSEETSGKFFGKENPLGKILTMGKLGDFVVTGVMKEKLQRSHIDFDAFFSASSIRQLENEKRLPSKSESWNSFQDAYTYVLVKPVVKRKNLENVLNGINKEINKDSKDGRLDFEAQSLQSITPSQDLLNDMGKGTTWGKLLALVGIGLIILLSACFNYTNLTIARALTRAREVGIRKVAGAKRYQIFIQYIVESVLIAFLALLCGFILLAAIIRYNLLGDGSEMPSFDKDALVIFYMFVFALVTGLIAGVAPAWILSSFKPVNVLKNLSAHKIFGNISLQKILIVFQFSLSLVIIIFLSAFYKQFDYMSKADYGFNQSNILTIPIVGTDGDILANELSGIAGVKKISSLSDNFGRYPSGKLPVALERNQGKPIDLHYYFGDVNLIPMMRLKLLAGSNFLPSGEADNHLILNEKAVEALRFKNIRDVIGKSLWINDSTNMQVIGVIQNFHFQNLGIPISPMALRSGPGAYAFLNLEVEASQKENLVPRVEKIWKAMNPHEQFSYAWLDKKLHDQNAQDDTIATLGYLAFIAISIAALGLLGLVVYTIETKRKEISIRKIIGAEVLQLVMLLSRAFIKLLLIAGAIAMPAGYILSYIFLQNFASRVNFGMFSLLSCFSLLLLIGLATIISQTYKASTVNPVKNLRTE